MKLSTGMQGAMLAGTLLSGCGAGFNSDKSAIRMMETVPEVERATTKVEPASLEEVDQKNLSLSDSITNKISANEDLEKEIEADKRVIKLIDGKIAGYNERITLAKLALDEQRQKMDTLIETAQMLSEMVDETGAGEKNKGVKDQSLSASYEAMLEANDSLLDVMRQAGVDPEEFERNIQALEAEILAYEAAIREEENQKGKLIKSIGLKEAIIAKNRREVITLHGGRNKLLANGLTPDETMLDYCAPVYAGLDVELMVPVTQEGCLAVLGDYMDAVEAFAGAEAELVHIAPELRRAYFNLSDEYSRVQSAMNRAKLRDPNADVSDLENKQRSLKIEMGNSLYAQERDKKDYARKQLIKVMGLSLRCERGGDRSVSCLEFSGNAVQIFDEKFAEIPRASRVAVDDNGHREKVVKARRAETIDAMRIKSVPGAKAKSVKPDTVLRRRRK